MAASINDLLHLIQDRSLRPASAGERSPLLASPRRVKREARRAHLIVDFIAGTTDHYALETYQVLQGIRIQ